jgi:hypothetical protein
LSRRAACLVDARQKRQGGTFDSVFGASATFLRLRLCDANDAARRTKDPIHKMMLPVAGFMTFMRRR